MKLIAIFLILFFLIPNNYACGGLTSSCSENDCLSAKVDSGTFGPYKNSRASQCKVCCGKTEKSVRRFAPYFAAACCMATCLLLAGSAYGTYEMTK